MAIDEEWQRQRRVCVIEIQTNEGCGKEKLFPRPPPKLTTVATVDGSGRRRSFTHLTSGGGQKSERQLCSSITCATDSLDHACSHGEASEVSNAALRMAFVNSEATTRM